MNKGMCTLGEWYWQHGVQRGSDPSDTDRDLRKISIGGWLDPLSRLAGRMETIRANIDGKACIALWGPSQTGKSTMLSRYIDGERADGTDSALTWNPGRPVRFSPPSDIGANLELLYPDTLVFNPFNHNSDASGVATRYVLRDEGDSSVNPEYPVEIRLASRAQLLHAIALGYCTECQSGSRLGHDSFLSDMVAGEDDRSQGMPQAEAYSLLKDLADVIELMRTEDRFADLFSRRDWDKKVRPNLVGCSSLLASVSASRKKLEETLWDGDPKLSAFFARLEQLRTTLLGKWNGAKKIVATQQAAALLLDIDTYRSVDAPNGDRALKVKRQVERLSWTFSADDGEVRIWVGKAASTSEIAGKAFGLFQTLCAELVVPVKRSALSGPGKECFLQLMEKCDLIDLPGLSNKNRGTNAAPEDADLVDLERAGDVELFTRVFKEGKTQSFVYSYAREFGVDAFVILARADRYPGKSALLSSGVGAWIRSFAPDWKKGNASYMPVFLNMTFFSNVINNVAMNGVGTGLTPVVARLQDTLTFAGKESSRWFVTTYPQFPDGHIAQPDLQSSVVQNIMDDQVFCSRTGLGREELEAVFGEDGGVGFMLQRIAAQIDPARRRARCREILAADWQTFERKIREQLPSGEELNVENRQRQLNECADAILGELERIENRESQTTYMELSRSLTELFSAQHEVFAPIPKRAMDKELLPFLKEQVAAWFQAKLIALPSVPPLDEGQLKTVLTALRDTALARIDGQGGLNDYVRTCLGQITAIRTCEAARLPFALAFGNVLRCGDWRREARGEEDCASCLDRLLAAANERTNRYEESPYWSTVFSPLLDRLRELGGNRPIGARPPQPGDGELADLLDQYRTRTTI